MRASGVVPRDPASHRPIGFRKVRKRMVPDALLFDASKPSLDDPVLLGRVRRDVLLPQVVASTGAPESGGSGESARCRSGPPAWPRSGGGSQSAGDTHSRARARLPSRDRARQPVAHELAIVAVNHRGEMGPAVDPTRDVRHVHRPARVADRRPTAAALQPGAWRYPPLMHEPALELEDAVERFRFTRWPSRNRNSAHKRRYPNVGCCCIKARSPTTIHGSRCRDPGRDMSETVARKRAHSRLDG